MSKYLQLILVLTLIFFNSVANAKSGAGPYFPADGFVVTVKSNFFGKDIFKVRQDRIVVFCKNNRDECEWVRAEEYLKHRLKRDDIEFAGMSHDYHNQLVILYFSEINNEVKE